MRRLSHEKEKEEAPRVDIGQPSEPSSGSTAPPVTADSIARAKQAQQAERQRVFEQTGIRIVDDGDRLDAFTIVCPFCLAPVGGANRGKADRAFARHAVRVHFGQRAS
jgi:hypothetical protein